MRDSPQLTHVRHDDLMAQFLQLLADPDRVRPRFHRNPCWRQISEPLRDGLRCCPETASTNDLSAFVEDAVVAPDTAKIDPDRHLHPGVPAWNFRDEMLLASSWGTVSPIRKDMAHPIYRYRSTSMSTSVISRLRGSWFSCSMWISRCTVCSTKARPQPLS